MRIAGQDGFLSAGERLYSRVRAFCLLLHAETFALLLCRVNLQRDAAQPVAAVLFLHFHSVRAPFFPCSACTEAQATIESMVLCASFAEWTWNRMPGRLLTLKQCRWCCARLNHSFATSRPFGECPSQTWSEF